MGGSSFIVVKTFLPAGGLPSSLVWFPALDPRPQTRGPVRCELVPCPGSQTTDQGTSPVTTNQHRSHGCLLTTAEGGPLFSLYGWQQFF
ncbi:unnamed protein product [Gadus morhua 'NCC']